MKRDIKEVLLSEEVLQKRIRELGAAITKDYPEGDLMVICVLKGAVLFMSDLVKAIDRPLEMDFMAVSSYGDSTESSGIVKIVKDLNSSIEGRNVLIVEDIIDSGLTLRYLLRILKEREPASLKVCALLEREGQKTGHTFDYTGFVVPDGFLVGYGLDFAEKYRNLPYIGILDPSVYE